MKKIIITVILSLLLPLTGSYSKEKITVVTLFKQYISAQNKIKNSIKIPKYKLLKRKGRWVTQNPDFQNNKYYFNIIVDIRNGFIQISDPETGGGYETYTCTLFIDTKRNRYLAIHHETSGGTIGSIFQEPQHFRFYRLKNNRFLDETDRLVPSISIKEFLKPHAIKNRKTIDRNIKKHLPHYFNYKLPRYGLKIEVTFTFDSFLDLFKSFPGERSAFELNDNNTFRDLKRIRNHFKKFKIFLKWNIKKGTFEIQ